MGIVDGAKKFLLNVALKKGIQKVVQVGLAYLTSVGLTTAMDAMGINLNVNKAEFEAWATAAITGGLEVVRNWLKVKVPALGKVL